MVLETCYTVLNNIVYGLIKHGRLCCAKHDDLSYLGGVENPDSKKLVFVLKLCFD